MSSYAPAGGAEPPLPPHLDPRGRHRGGPGGSAGRSGAGRVLLVMMTLVSAALLVLAGYVWYTFRDVNNGVKRIQVAVGVQPSNAVKEFNGKDVNILLVGNDDRSNMTDKEVHALHVGRDGGSLATDTMMIVHIPANGQKATLISLPRDSWVSIENRGKARLNSAYADAYVNTKGTADQKKQAGANALIGTVSRLTGLTIDHYIQVDLLGFYRISNAIGGVPVTMCHAVDDTVRYNQAHGQGTAGSGLVLSKGKHTLKGLQALEFVRQRHNLPNGDLDRVRRQQYFLTAAFRQVASVGVLFKLRSVGNAITQSVFTDQTLNLLDLGRQLENLTANNITGKTIPTSPQNIDGQDVLAVDPAKVKRFVSKVINPPAATAKPSTSATPKTQPKTGASASPKKSAAAIDAKCIN